MERRRAVKMLKQIRKAVDTVKLFKTKFKTAFRIWNKKEFKQYHYNAIADIVPTYGYITFRVM